MAEPGAEADAAVFKLTTKFKAVVAIINEVDEKKFPHLLRRIIATPGDKPFSDDEQQQLCSALKLSEEALTGLLEVCSFVYNKAAYHGMDANVLKLELTNAGVDMTRIRPICLAWHESGAEFVEKLKARTLTPRALETLNWRLQLELGQSTLSSVKEPRTLFEFGLKDTTRAASDKAGDGGDALERVVVEMSSTDLRSFFNQLELIQEQLDALASGGA